MNTQGTITAMITAVIVLGACVGNGADDAPPVASTATDATDAAAEEAGPYHERLRNALASIRTIHRSATPLATNMAVGREPSAPNASELVAEARSAVSTLDADGAPSGVHDAVQAYLNAIVPVAEDIDAAVAANDLAAYAEAEQALVTENAALLNAADGTTDACQAVAVVIGHAEHGPMLCPPTLPGGEWGEAAHRVMRTYAIRTTPADPNRIGFVEPLAQEPANRPPDTFTNVPALRTFYDAVLPTTEAAAEDALARLAALTPPSDLTAWQQALSEHVQAQQEGRQVLLELARAGAPGAELAGEGANSIADASRAISAALGAEGCVLGVTLDRSALGCS